MRERIFELTTPEEVQGFLAQYPSSLIFKAGTCHKTTQGFGQLEAALSNRPDLPVGVIRVVEARPASNYVAELTQIRHESPQVIVFSQGQPVYEANNWGIAASALVASLAQVPTSSQSFGGERITGELEPYFSLLKTYLAGELDPESFEIAYSSAFREDASLRPQDEVEIIGGLFGDVDAHAEMHRMFAGQVDDSRLRARAQETYQKLQALAGARVAS